MRMIFTKALRLQRPSTGRAAVFLGRARNLSRFCSASASSSSFFQQQEKKDSFKIIVDTKGGRYFTSINNNSSTTKFSSLSAVMDHQDHHDDDDHYDQHDQQQQQHHHYYNATTNGKTVSLSYIKEDHDNNIDEGGEEKEDLLLTFHSSWLWINDPKNVHPTSFQKMRSLGQYPGCSITYARVITDNNNDEESNNNNNNMLNININFPKSPSRYLHSRGGMYNENEDELKITEKKEEKEQQDDFNNNNNDDHRTMLQIFWDTGDESFYDLDWLLRCRSIATTTSDTTNKNNSSKTNTISDFLQRTQVTKDIAIGSSSSSKSNDIQRLDYSFVMNDNEGKFQALHEIMEHGAVLIQNAPPSTTTTTTTTTSPSNNGGGDDQKEEEEYIVAELGRYLSGSGQLSHGSLYGDVFHVQSMSDAHNIAYTNEELPPHQDLTYYESKPFLQLLHCVHDPTKVLGGESVLVDAMAAAEYLREISPDLFDVLTKVPCTFVKQRDGADMVSCKPHIVVDNVYNQVVTVNWSPPFEGPLLHLPSNITMEDYVCAYQAMECMLNNRTLPTTTTTTTSSSSSLMLLPESIEKACTEYSKSYTWEYSLQKNEILIFNNQRMVHARRSFDVINPQINKRHLIGCYTDAMDTISSYRILLRQRLQQQQQQSNNEIIGIRNAGNGYLGI